MYYQLRVVFCAAFTEPRILTGKHQRRTKLKRSTWEICTYRECSQNENGANLSWRWLNAYNTISLCVY